MLWPKIGSTYFHAQLGTANKGNLIKGLLSAKIKCYITKLTNGRPVYILIDQR